MAAKNNKLQLNTAESSSAIYEGGSLSKISIEDLMNNEVAIRQLINNYNELIRENDDNKREASELKTSLEHIKTTPFVAILSAVINVIGTIIIGIGVNQCSNNNHKINALIILGSILIIVCNVATILYPYCRGWFNKVSEI